MLERYRQLLLTQYIGAIVVAFMLVDGISSTIAAIVSTATTVYLRSRVGSFPEEMGAQVEKTLSYGSLIATAIRAVLFFGVAFLLVRWLYPGTASLERDSHSVEEAE